MKIREFQFILEKKGCDFAIFYNTDSSGYNPNLLYFSGYDALGCLIVPKSREPFLLVPEMELQRAEKSISKKGFSGVFKMEKKRFFESIYKTITGKSLRKSKIALDKNNFTLSSFNLFRKTFKKIKISDVGPDCLKLREIKTEKEIMLLRKSCGFADKIIQKAINNFKEFKTESQASAFLEYETKKAGFGLSFNPIVASAGNASMPHHEPSNAKIKKGFCVIDFGVKYKGYCSDITRTIYFGVPLGREKDIYRSLLDTQNGAINQIMENKKCSELYDFTVKTLGKFKNNFTHGLGHGVGVQIHELPNLTLNSKERIRNNMVFTVEPGVYFPKKFGIRIEDTILFKGNAEVLTKTPKELITI